MYKQEKEQVAYFMRRLYRQFLTTTSGGNISCRLPDGNILITASQSDKCELAAEHVGVVTPDGRSLTPDLKLSIESGLHLAIYRARPETGAIIHAHPTTASFFCAADEEINIRLTAEAYAILGKIVKIPYALMGTEELAQNTATGMRNCDCGLLENHGVITIGKNLLAAFDKMELLENAARQTLMSHSIKTHSLNAAQLRELDHFMGRDENNENK